MDELVLHTPQYVQNSVAFSRNREEAVGVASGSQGYGSFAGLISCHLNELDSIFESASEQAARFAVNHINEEQFKNPKNGKFRNFIKRNFVTIQSRGERTTNRKYTESLQKVHTDFTNL